MSKTTSGGPSSGTTTASSTSSTDSQAKWEFGDVGFDTEKKLWFVQLFNEVNQNVGTYLARSIVMKKGNAAQYQWKDLQGRAFWHVRERFLAEQIESIAVAPDGSSVTLYFKDDQPDPDAPRAPEGVEGAPVPVEFDHIHYAFHLSNKEIAVGNRAPFGFLEFYDASGNLVYVINNKWIVIEGLDRKTVGAYPKIRLRIDRKDVERIITSRTVVIVQGKQP